MNRKPIFDAAKQLGAKFKDANDVALMAERVSGRQRISRE